MNKPYFCLSILFLLLSAIIIKAESFQQKVNYKIEVRLDDREHFLHAFEELEYINNSPDTLRYIYFHLYPNAYSSNKTAFARQQLLNGSTKFYYADESRRGYIDSLNFKTGEVNLKWEYDPRHVDIAKVYLKEPLPPRGTVFITTPFRVKLPDSFSRLGHIGQQYQITQWYPKPAVYDRRGWHQMPYFDQGEFFSEFGSFDVSITLPENYVVGATGNLQTLSEKEFLRRKAQETQQKESFPLADPFPPSSEAFKTLRYIQDNVHDFAWFADKRYNVKTGYVKLPHSQREVFLLALFNNADAAAWKNIITYMRDGTYFYSEKIGDYPYDIVTVVDGALSAGSGMEYPTITVLGASSPYFLEQVVVHEIGHNWFYGILANNERRFPWLDEGFNSFYEMRYFEEKYPSMAVLGINPDTDVGGIAQRVINMTDLDKFPNRKLYEWGYLSAVRRGTDQVANLPATEYTSFNYGAIVYHKSTVMLDHLRSYLGNNVFDQAMQRYYQTFQFKHVWPEDVQGVFEEVSGKDLNWFFKDMAGSGKKVDYSLKRAKSGKQHTKLRIKNKENIPAPLHVAAYRNGNMVDEQWYEGFTDSRTITIPAGDIEEVVIDPDEVMMEFSRHNNFSRTGGLFPRMQQLEFNLLGTPEKGNRTQINFFPVAGLNTSDKFLAGVAFYNSTFPPRQLQYNIMPMYSFGLNRLSGMATVNYHVTPEANFQRITYTAHAEAFAGYRKLEPRLSIEFVPARPLFSPKKTLNIRHSHIWVDGPIDHLYPDQYQLITGDFSIGRDATLWTAQFTSGFHSDYQTFVQWQNYASGSWMYRRGRNIKLRLFYGQFLLAENVHPAFHFYMAGSPDPQMRHVFVDRAQISERYRMLIHQTDGLHGGFRGFSALSSDNWLSSANFTFDLPFSRYISLYSDIGFAGGLDNFEYNGGIQLNVWKNIFEFYLPVIGSPYENAFPESFSNFRNNFRFMFRFNAINPWRLLEANLQ